MNNFCGSSSRLSVCRQRGNDNNYHHILTHSPRLLLLLLLLFIILSLHVNDVNSKCQQFSLDSGSTEPYGEINLAARDTSVASRLIFYEYWPQQSGWIALGFSNTSDIEMTGSTSVGGARTARGINDDDDDDDDNEQVVQPNELYNVTLLVFFKQLRRVERGNQDGEYDIPYSVYTLENSSDWSTLKFRYSSQQRNRIREVSSHYDQDKLLSYSGILFNVGNSLLDRDNWRAMNPSYAKYVLAAKNMDQRFEEGYITNNNNNNNTTTATTATASITTSTSQGALIPTFQLLAVTDFENVAGCLNWYSYRFRKDSYLITTVFSFLFVMSFVILIGLGNCCAVICYRNHKRVSSRLPTIILSTILLLLVNALDIASNIFAQVRMPMGAQACWAASMALFIIAFFMYMMLMVRYFHVRNVYRLISRHKNKTPDQLSRLLRVHKQLSSRWTTIVITLVFSLIMAAVFTCVGIFVKWDPQGSRYKSNIVRFSITAAMFVVEFAALMVDTVLNWSTLRSKGLRYHFFFDDPLYFRLEMLSAILIPLGSLIVMILELVFFTQLESFTITTKNTHIVFMSVVAFFILIQFIIYYWTSGGGFAVAIDRYAYFKKLIINLLLCRFGREVFQDEEVPLSELEAFLVAGDDEMAMIEDYCEREFSSENLMLWKELFEIKKADRVSFTKASEIMKNYLERNCVMEVNIDGKTRKALQTRMAELEEKKADSVDWEVFKACYSCILTNLADTYSRLCKTDEFDRLVASKKLERELLEKNFHHKEDNV